MKARRSHRASRRSGRARLRALVIASIVSVTSLAQSATTARALECAGEGGPVISAVDARAMVDEQGGLMLEAGATLDVPLDRALLCRGASAHAGAPCLVTGAIDLECVRLAKGVLLDGVSFASEFSLEDARIDGDFVLARGEVRGSVVLVGAHVTGTSRIESVQAGGDVRLDDLACDDDLSVRDLEAKGDVSLQGAVARGAIRLDGVRARMLDAAVDRARSLSIARTHIAGDVHVDDVDVDTAFDVEIATIGGAFDSAELRVGGNARLAGIEAAEGVFVSGTFGAPLEIAGARTPAALRIAATTVRGDLVVRAIDAGEFVIEDARVTGSLAIEYSSIVGLTRFTRVVAGGEVRAIGSRFGDGWTRDGVHAERGLRAVDCEPPDIGEPVHERRSPQQ